MFKKLLLVVFLLTMPGLALAATQAPEGDASVAQDAELTTWRYPVAGLEFDHPADWQISLRDENFDFVIFMPSLLEGEAPRNFVGAQVGLLGGEDTLQSVMDRFQESFGGELNEDDSFGDVDVLRLDLPEDADAGRWGVIYSYQPTDDSVVLLIISGAEDDRALFEPGVTTIMDTINITPLVLDHDALNAALLESFEENQTLTLGDFDAPITIMEVLDFSCPHCVDYSDDMRWLIADYAMTNQIRFQFSFVTFVGQERSEIATSAQYCATSLGFGWDMHEGIMDLYRQNGSAVGYTLDNIVAIADALDNADADALQACIEDGTYTNLIERDANVTSVAGVQSTPAVLLGQNGDIPGYLVRADGTTATGALPMYFLYDYLDGLLSE